MKELLGDIAQYIISFFKGDIIRSVIERQPTAFIATLVGLSIAAIIFRPYDKR